LRPISKENQTSESKINFAEYWRVFWRKKYFVLVPTLLAGTIAIIGVRFIAPVFAASSTISIEDQDYLSREVEQFVNVSARARRRVQDEDTLAKLTAEFRSTAFLNELIHHLRIEQDADLIAQARVVQQTTFPDMSVGEIVLQKLRSRLKNKFKISLAGPGIFKISAYDYNREACYVLADAATTAFIDFQQRKQLRGLKQVGEFGEQQLVVYKKRLEESELELENLEKAISRWKLEDNPVTEQSLRQAETLRQRLNVKIDDIEDIAARIRGRIRGLIGTMPSSQRLWQDPELEDIRDGLTARRETVLRLELAGRAVMTQEWQDSKSGILEDENAMQRRLSALVDIHHTDIPADHRPLLVEYLFQVAQLESYTAQRSKLASDIIKFENKLSELPQMEMELSRRREQVRTDRALYNSFIRAKTSTQISEAIHQTGLGGTIEVMEKPKRPSGPVRPNKRAIIVLALLFGTGLGMVGLVLTEYSDTSFRKVEEIEQVLSLRVLGTIPHFESGAKWNQAKQRRQAVIWGAISVVVMAASLFGFYYYGKAAEKQAIRVYLTSTQQVGNQNEATEDGR
jgi:uncharacterized protein involved in exopolysaccharide biosynthesis